MRAKHRVHIVCLALLICTVAVSGCSTLISNSLANALSGGEEEEEGMNPLLSDDDPDLIRDALPFTLKLLDILINADIDDPAIRLVAAQAYTAYAVLFLQQEANTVARDDFEHRTRLLERSKIHLLRAREYALSALDTLYPGFIDAINGDDYESALAEMTSQDVPYLYFAAAAWIGAATVDIFDLELSITIPRAAEMIHRAFALNPDYSGGALHEFYIIYFAALPEYLGGDKDRAEFHYQEALRVSNNLSASAHVSMALGISLPAQNAAQFRQFLEQALDIDVDQDVNRRLTNIIRQREAQWYLDNMELFFIDS